MRRPIWRQRCWLAALCTAAACASAPRTQPPPQEERVAVGRVVGVSPVFDAFTVVDERTGEPIRLDVEEPSRLFYGDAPVEFTALEPGSIVRASYVPSGTGGTALRVEVLSHPGELDGTRDWDAEQGPRGGRPAGSEGGR